MNVSQLILHERQVPDRHQERGKERMPELIAWAAMIYIDELGLLKENGKVLLRLDFAES